MLTCGVIVFMLLTRVFSINYDTILCFSINSYHGVNSYYGVSSSHGVSYCQTASPFYVSQGSKNLQMYFQHQQWYTDKSKRFTFLKHNKSQNFRPTMFIYWVAQLIPSCCFDCCCCCRCHHGLWSLSLLWPPPWSPCWHVWHLRLQHPLGFFGPGQSWRLELSVFVGNYMSVIAIDIWCQFKVTIFRN